MNDERLGKEIGEFYRETDVTPPESRESARQVASRLPQTPQVKRRRWIPSWLQRSAATPVPTQVPDDTTPEVTGRTRTMLSPTVAATASVLVFALGGLFLVAQPFEQQGSPGAAMEPIAPTWITGTIKAAPSCTDGGSEDEGDVRRERGTECSPQAWTSSDGRLTGDVVRRWNTDIYTTDGVPVPVSVDADTAYLRNADGAWTCTSATLLTGFAHSAQVVGGPGYTFDCVGEGGYAGLSARLVMDEGPGFDEEFVGLVFSGGFPPQPEPPTPE